MKKVDFIKKCNQAREHVLKMNSIMQEIFDELTNECLELPTDAENADTVEDAICCYIQYGEYNPEDIWKEITSR